MWQNIQVLWLDRTLHSQDPARRQRAAEGLARIHSVASVAALRRALCDSDEQVRHSAIVALGEFRDPSAVVPLIKLLAECDEQQRWSEWAVTARALGQLRAPEAVEPILTSLRGRYFGANSASVHQTALTVAAEIGGGRAALIAFVDQSDGRLTPAAVSCLQQIGPAAIETLRDELLTLDWRCHGIADALDRLGWRPTTQQERIAWGLARPDRQLLGVEGAAALESMRKWYLSQGVPERQALLPQFGALPTDKVGPVLREFLRACNSNEERQSLAELIGQKQVVDAVPDLVTLLHHPWKLQGIEPIVGALVRLGAASAGPVQEAMAAGQIDGQIGLQVLHQVGGVRADSTLINLLGKADPTQRRMAQETLERLGWSPKTPHEQAMLAAASGKWLEALRLDGAEMRARLQDALRCAYADPPERELFEAAAQLGDSELLLCIFRWAEHGQDETAQVAREVLAALGRASLPLLLRELNDGRPSRAKTAELVLARMGELVTSDLRSQLADPATRVRAAQALQLIADQKPGSSEQSVAEKAELLVMQGKLLEAGELGSVAVGPLTRAWPDADLTARMKIVQALGELRGEEAIALLLQALEYPADMAIWQDAARFLGKQRERRALPRLLHVLEFDMGSGGLVASEALGLLGDEAAVPLLLKRLEDSTNERVAAAAKALAELGDRRAVEPLLRMLHRGTSSEGRNWQVDDARREIAAAVLGSFGDLAVIEPLLEAIRYYRSGGKILDAALSSFRTFGANAMDALQSILQDQNSPLRAAAIAALGQIADQTVQPILLPALRDEAAEVRETAAQTLRQLGWSPADDAERCLASFATRDFNAIAGLGADAVAPLVQFIEQGRANRAPAAHALASLRGSDVFGALRKLLRHSNVHVAVAAVDALAACEPSRAVEVFLAELTEPMSASLIRSSILCQLGAIGDERAVPRLLAHLQLQDGQVQLALIKLAWRLPQVAAGLVDRLSPTQPRTERFFILDFVGRLPLEQQPPLIEPLVDDPDESLREAAWTHLEKLTSYIRRPELKVEVFVRRIEHDGRGFSSKLREALATGSANSSNTLLHRVLALAPYVDCSVVYEYRQVDANNHDAGHDTISRTSHVRFDYEDSKAIAREELRRRGVD